VIAPLRTDKIVQYDIIYVSFYGFLFILVTTRCVEHENSNTKKGVEMAMVIGVTESRKGQSCKNRQYRATGNTGQTQHRMKTRKRIKRRYQI